MNAATITRTIEDNIARTIEDNLLGSLMRDPMFEHSGCFASFDKGVAGDTHFGPCIGDEPVPYVFDEFDQQSPTTIVLIVRHHLVRDMATHFARLARGTTRVTFTEQPRIVTRVEGGRLFVQWMVIARVEPTTTVEYRVP